MATGYLSLLLSPESSKLLAETYASLEETVCHHMTLVWGTHELDALPKAFKGAEPGDTYTLRVFGIARSDSVEAVAVGLLKDGKIVISGISDNETAHITVSLAPGARAVQSNDLLEQGFELVSNGPELTAKLEVTKFGK